jgi:septal ring-binding cell division protein DamX
MRLEKQLNQVERDMQSRLFDKGRELSVRLDTLQEALSEQAAKRESLHDTVNYLNSDLATNNQVFEERIDSIDLRLSSYIDQQAALPDPLAPILTLIEEHKEKVGETLKQLREELSGLHEKYQMLDTDEHEAADWLSSLAAGLDKQAEDQERLQQSFDSVKTDISRGVDEVKARLIIAERLFKEHEETVQELSRKLSNLAEDIAEQSRHGVDLKLTTTALQEDAGGLKESHRTHNERLEALARSLRQGEQTQARVSQQLYALEQAQKELHERGEVGMDSLQERIQIALAQLAEQSGVAEGLSQRLEDLESTLQGQLNDIDTQYQQLQEAAFESRQRLAHQEQGNITLSAEITAIKTEHQGLLEQTDNQRTSLEAMTTEYGKRQEESEQMVQRVDLLGAQMESNRVRGTHQSIAIGGLFVLLLLCIVLGYQFVSSEFGSVERDFSLELMNVSENYLTRDKVEQLMNNIRAAKQTADDALVVDELMKQQQALAQRLNEFEQQIAESITAAAKPLATTGQTPAGEKQALEPPTETMQLEQQPQQRGQQPKSQQSWQVLRNSGGYTIQLIGVSSRDSIGVFAAKHSLQGELAYIATERAGEAWYILLYGMYESYTEAVKAIQDLPDNLKSQQPWVRKMPSTGSINGL